MKFHCTIRQNIAQLAMYAVRLNPGRASVTLRDIYIALGSPSLLAMGNHTDVPGCLVEQAVNAALSTTFDAAEALLLARLGDVTLDMLNADVARRLARRGHAANCQ